MVAGVRFLNCLSVFHFTLLEFLPLRFIDATRGHWPRELRPVRQRNRGRSRIRAGALEYRILFTPVGSTFDCPGDRPGHDVVVEDSRPVNLPDDFLLAVGRAGHRCVDSMDVAFGSK